MTTTTRTWTQKQKDDLITETISLQASLNTNLTSLIKKIPTTTIPTTTIPTTTTPATTQRANFEPFTDLAISSNNYSPNNFQYINNYKNSFNQINDIIDTDDATKYNQRAFDTYLHIQNQKIAELELSVDNMPTRPNVVRPIKAIKNVENSQTLNVEKYPIPTGTGTMITTPNDYYLIYANNRCVEFIPPTTSTATGITSPNTNAELGYDMRPCNASKPNQQFKLNYIPNFQAYNNNIHPSNTDKYTLNNADSSVYGFYSVNPNNDSYNKHCLQLNDDGLSVVPCNLEGSQRFKPFYQSVLP